MYAIWDLDLYIYNNFLWDTRPQKMKNLMYNKYIIFPRDAPLLAVVTDDEKREILRIYRDIVYNTTIQTLKRYTHQEWKTIISITKSLKYLCNKHKQDKTVDWVVNEQLILLNQSPYHNAYKSDYKIIRTCDGVCEMIRLALSENDIFADQKTEDEFWKCMVQLCDTTDFRFFWHKNYKLNKSEYFANLVHALYLDVVWHSTKSKYQAKFESLVIVLYYIYKMALDNQKDWMNEPDFKFDVKLVFSEEVIEKIDNIKCDEPFFHGKYLLDLVDYQTRNETKQKL